MSNGRNFGIKVPGPGEASLAVRTAIQQIITKLGMQSTPRFAGVSIGGQEITAAVVDEWSAAYDHKVTEDVLNGLVKCNGSGVYSSVTDNSAAWDSAVSSSHAAATVSDTSSLDLSITGQQISGTVLPAGVDHDALQNFVINEHVDHSSVSVVAGTGMSGGGDLTASRTLNCTITQYTDALARAALSDTITGIDYSGATGVFSLTSGYVIPTTTEETNWNTAYGWGNWSHTTLSGYGITDACPLAHKTTEDAINGLVFCNGAGTYSAKTIGTDVQAYDAGLAGIAGLAKTDGNIIVGDGSSWVAESGATARTSLGLGTGDSPTFAGFSCIRSGGGSMALALALASSAAYYVRPYFDVRRARGTIGGESALLDGDYVSSFEFSGYSDYLGGTYVYAGGFGITVSGTVDASHVPTRLYFDVNAGVSASTRMELIYDLFTVAPKIRSNTGFNINGTDGLSQTTGNPGSITSSGGIITAMTANPYGSIQGSDLSITVTVTTVDVPVEIDSGLSGGPESGMTFQNSHEVKCLTAGNYLCNYAVSVEAVGVANRLTRSSIMVNGSIASQGCSLAEVSPGGSGRETVLAGSAILTLAVNDVVSLALTNHDDAADYVVRHLSLNLVKVGS
jgi:acyl-CoA synthetase (AMP-forming)/AMP-acid ligase II